MGANVVKGMLVLVGLLLCVVFIQFYACDRDSASDYGLAYGTVLFCSVLLCSALLCSALFCLL